MELPGSESDFSHVHEAHQILIEIARMFAELHEAHQNPAVAAEADRENFAEIEFGKKLLAEFPDFLENS